MSKMNIGEVRFSYVSVLEPREDMNGDNLNTSNVVVRLDQALTLICVNPI